jgi:transcriptional repressor NrdR
VRATGSAELTTHDVGLAILGPLQELDLVAYLRFASVYRAFDSLEDFDAAIAELRETGPPAADDEDRGEAVDGEEAVAGSQEDDRGPGGTAQLPEPARAAD